MLQALRYVRPLLLGRPLHGAERYGPFFIVGSGRCGTTLLRAVLEAHPDVHIPPGNVALRHVISEFRWYARLPWSPLLRLILGHLAFHRMWEGFDLSLGPLFRELAACPRPRRNLAAVLDAVYRAHGARHKPSAVRWGDKSPFSVLGLPGLRAVFPDLRVVHIVRDGRDVAASFADAFGDGVQRAAMVWLRAIRAAHAFGARHPGQYLEVRYEDLVRRPEATIGRVAAFLDLSFDASMLRHHEHDLRLGDVDRTPYMQGVRGPIHEKSVGRWRRCFDAGQAAELHRLIGPTLAALGYEGVPGRAS
jgi:hypothetical protein